MGRRGQGRERGEEEMERCKDAQANRERENGRREEWVEKGGVRNV